MREISGRTTTNHLPISKQTRPETAPLLCVASIKARFWVCPLPVPQRRVFDQFYRINCHGTGDSTSEVRSGDCRTALAFMTGARDQRAGYAEITDLRDCPFCASSDLAFLAIDGELAVHCPECGASGPKTSDPDHAAFAWNQRYGRLSVAPVVPPS